MPEFVDWRNTADPAALVEHAVAALRRGDWVVTPTECGCAAMALADRAAVDRLPAGELDWSLTLPDLARVLAQLGTVGERLIRRSWPGPAIFEIEDGGSESLAGPLNPQVYQRTVSDGAWTLRLPGHELALILLDSVGEPVVLAEPEEIHRSGFIASLGEGVPLILEEGPPPFEQRPTRIRIAGNTWRIQRPGVYPEAELQRLAAIVIVFLCTGNTCRSPM